QRERGLSNVMLTSQGRRFVHQRNAQMAECLRLEHEVRLGFDQLETEGRRLANGTRLFSSIAWVLAGLDALPVLRQRITQLDIDAAEAVAAFGKLVAGLLGVVFEAADGATDPAISRLLTALFNFMQGKEYAGQERACGGAAFAEGRCDPQRQRAWAQLIAAQERCFQVYDDFAGPALAEIWRRSQSPTEVAELERLRRIGCSTAEPLDAELSAAWFDCCSLRIDAMRAVEEDIGAALRELCAARVAAAKADVKRQEALSGQVSQAAGPTDMAFFEQQANAPTEAQALAAATPRFGHQLERSVLDMLQEQTQRVQAMSDELDAVRSALNERKLVERAKGLLMARRRLSEAEAHKMLRQTAMNQNRRLVDVAESVLAMADFLPGGGAS
ncbi:MAG: nitrate- and nitrite sensing domain-containing protein, partial [Gammaproteobacteria bacterium]|nr:nitrate- and nitrite sensing domain-containing protein [Gammaproteobacteria bacterium]